MSNSEGPRGTRGGHPLMFALSVAGCVMLAWAYVRFDGGTWWPSAWQLLRAHALGASSIFAVFFCVGIGVGLSARSGRYPSVIVALLLLSAVVLGSQRFWSLPVVLPLASAPDWARSLFVTMGYLGASTGFALVMRFGALPAGWVVALFVSPAVLVAATAGALGDLVSLCVMLVGGAGLGSRVWQLLVQNRSTPRFVISLGIGWIVFGATAAAIGTIGVSLHGVLLAAPVALLVASHRETRRLLVSWSMALRAPLRWGLANGLMAGLLAATAFLAWVAALSPEIGPDAIGGRVALPVAWLRDGALAAYPELTLSFMGLGGETFFLFWLPWTGENVARLVAFASSLAIGSYLFQLGRRKDRDGFWSSAACFLLFSSTVVSWQFIHGFVDLLQALYAIAAIAALSHWLEKEEPGALVASGLLGGAATAVKLNGAATVIIAVIVVGAASLYRDGALGKTARRIALVIGPAAIVTAPWLLRSWWLTGNPIFPFANGFFQSPLAPTALVVARKGEIAPLDWLAIPWHVLSDPGKFVELGTIHPLFLVAGLVTVGILRRGTRSARLIACAAALATALWVVTEQNLRYALFPLALWAATLSVGSSSVRAAQGRHWKALALIGLAVGYVLMLARPTAWMWQVSGGPALPSSYVAGLESAESYRSRFLPVARVAGFMNRNLPTTRRVWLMPWQRDHLSFDSPVIALPFGDERVVGQVAALLPNNATTSLDEASRVLHELEVDYLVMDTSSPWTALIPESDWPGIYSEEFRTQHLDLLFAHAGLRLYRLRPPDETGPSLSPRFAFSPVVLIAEDRSTPEVPSDVITSRSFSVAEEQLYGVEIEVGGTGHSNGNLQLAWRRNDGELLYFQGFPIPESATRATHRVFQTAPPGATSVDVFFPAGLISADWLVSHLASYDPR